MTDEPRIQQLIEQIMDSGHTPEQACAGYPQLLPAVRDRWQRMCEVEAQLEMLFPTPGPSNPRGNAALKRPLGASGELPQIPGYEVQSVLGSGGMGVVYKARHLKLKRTVAVKMMLRGAGAAPRELACLMSEAASVAGLRH
ncbi:MAG: serine/threonine protein kinase, partial [Pyrinomonadaceae bacterium]|nr:serine/threonine protein kinase [Phycisphaerales bacterium]